MIRKAMNSRCTVTEDTCPEVRLCVPRQGTSLLSHLQHGQRQPTCCHMTSHNDDNRSSAVPVLP